MSISYEYGYCTYMCVHCDIGSSFLRIFSIIAQRSPVHCALILIHMLYAVSMEYCPNPAKQFPKSSLHFFSSRISSIKIFIRFIRIFNILFCVNVNTGKYVLLLEKREIKKLLKKRKFNVIHLIFFKESISFPQPKEDFFLFPRTASLNISSLSYFAQNFFEQVIVYVLLINSMKIILFVHIVTFVLLLHSIAAIRAKDSRDSYPSERRKLLQLLHPTFIRVLAHALVHTSCTAVKTN